MNRDNILTPEECVGWIRLQKYPIKKRLRWERSGFKMWLFFLSSDEIQMSPVKLMWPSTTFFWISRRTTNRWRHVAQVCSVANWLGLYSGPSDQGRSQRSLLPVQTPFGNFSDNISIPIKFQNLLDYMFFF